MTTHQKQDINTISMTEALDILYSLADPKTEDLKRKEPLVVDREVAHGWNMEKFSQLSSHDKEVLLKEIYALIYKTLRKYYDQEYTPMNSSETVEQIKNIMALAGEAAKKLDNLHTVLESGNIQDWKEYKKLQEFYLQKIAKKIDTATLGEWLLGLTQRAWKKEAEPSVLLPEKAEVQHVYVDLDAVKKDTEYELFYLRKQDATRFYSPRLLRNMMLVNDFGEKLRGQKQLSDPLAEIASWRDQAYLFAAKHLLKRVRHALEGYVREVMNMKDKELVAEINKCIMALLFTVDAPHQRGEGLEKSVEDYFADFLFYLHAALHHPDYQKMMTYEATELSRYQRSVKDTLQSLCANLFQEFKFYDRISEHVQELIAKGHEVMSVDHEDALKRAGTLCNMVASDYKALTKLFKNSPLRHVAKILEEIREGDINGFDPFHQKALPSRWYDITVGEITFANLHLPSPTCQEFIHKASVIDEFKAFLRACKSSTSGKNVLIINLQDRTSWKEHYRCRALEELSKHEEFRDNLHVVTLARDTEFYNQLEPYSRINHADVFLKQLYDQVVEVDNGFFFKEDAFLKLFPNFAEALIQGIHKVFFSEKNILLQDHRKDFIEIFYLFMQLKLIDMYHPDFFSLTCKDGVDNSACANAELFVFLKLLRGDTFTSQDRKLLYKMLYAPAMTLRERLIQPERFSRFLSVLKCMEQVRENMGAAEFLSIIKKIFGPLYDSSITAWEVHSPL